MRARPYRRRPALLSRDGRDLVATLLLLAAVIAIAWWAAGAPS